MMRLTLRKLLKPYSSLVALAEDLDLTVPELKRRVRRLESEGNLSLEALGRYADPDQSWQNEQDFELFHCLGRCLVCGNEMRVPPGRDIGWGEFKQCEMCQFSAHDLANYTSRKKAAREQLETLVKQARKTESVLRDRTLNSERLRQELPLSEVR